MYRLYYIFFSLFLIACEDNEDIYNSIKVFTGDIVISADSLIAYGVVESSAGNITEHGHCWTNKSDFILFKDASKTCLGPVDPLDTFHSVIRIPAGYYFMFAYAIDNNYLKYGEIKPVFVTGIKNN